MVAGGRHTNRLADLLVVHSRGEVLALLYTALVEDTERNAQICDVVAWAMRATVSC